MITSLADFKRKIQVGTKLGCIYFYPDGKFDIKPVREVSIKQSNCFALKTWSEKRQIWENSYCYYPKAKDCKFVDGKMEIYEDGKKILVYWIEVMIFVFYKFDYSECMATKSHSLIDIHKFDLFEVYSDEEDFRVWNPLAPEWENNLKIYWCAKKEE
jgi:hypothetical protein